MTSLMRLPLPLAAVHRASLQASFVLLLGVCAVGPAAAQQADRERAQMMQMQQQLQRLQSDNAAIQKERSDLQAKAQDAEKFRKDAGKDLAKAKVEAAARAKELADARSELAATHEQLGSVQSETEALKKTLSEREQALVLAATEKQRMESQIALLSARLKLQTQRADHCEVRHEAAMKFSAGVIDRFESDRLRLCEPVTGIWKVKAETQIQQMRDELYGYRLDVPDPAPAVVAPASAPEKVSAGSGAAAP